MEAEFLKLNKCLNNSESKEAESIINNITTALSENAVSLDIDACILQIFNEYTGLENFIKKALYKKDFATAVTQALELLYTLTKSFCSKIDKHILPLSKLCMHVVIVPNSGSLVKNKFAELLILIIDRPEKVFSAEEIGDIYNQIYEKFKYRDRNSVIGKIVQILGVISKRYPKVVRESDVLIQSIISPLEYDCTKYSENISILTGYFTYFSDFFESFCTDDANYARLYKCIKIIAGNLENSVKTAGRAALCLFGRHISKFSQFLIKDSNFWNNTLRSWLSRTGEDQKTGFSTLLSFNQELANILRDRTDDEAKLLFNKFFNMFYESLNYPYLHGYERRLSIRGIGIYACAFRTHRSLDELQNTFISIVHRMESLYLTDINICKANMDYLADYLEISTAFLKQFEFISSVQMSCLERLTILIFRMFPNLSVAHHGLVVESLVLTLYRLKCGRNDVLDNFLQSVIYQAVIWTCSHQIIADAEVLKLDSNQEVTTYKVYIPLWKNLLEINRTFCKKYDINIKDMILINQSLYDELIKVLFVLINKLNLNTQLIEKQEDSTLQAEKVNDFVIFVNVVDFYSEIFELIPKNYFKKWVAMYTNQIIEKSRKYPIVSGFYKLLSSCLIICDKLLYFDEQRLKKSHVKSSFVSVKQFIEDMIPKMAQYIGDLQLACLKLILVTSMEIIYTIEVDFAPIFITAFNVGRSYLQITTLALETLEKWQLYWPAEKLEPILMKVVPSLDSFLRSKRFIEHAEKPTLLKDTSKSKKLLKKRKMYAETEPELLNVQKMILVFLSKLNSDLCYEFVNANVYTEAVIWSDRSHLKLTLPFESGKGVIYLESFVPRILDLALNSSDGKTKMAAAEFLHSIIMVMLGTSSKMDLKRIEDLDKLLQKIIETVIKLACDYDNAIRQLYHLLLMQMMHWYSHPRQFKSAQTSIVLTALFDGVANPVHSDIRNISAIALHEFIKYTRKQTKESDLKKDPASIEAIIRTITSYNVHPDPIKRLAGALIFNNIYTELREESAIFNLFWIELFHSFVISLSLQQVSEDNCVVEINKALDRLTRGFIEKYSVFKKHDNNRKTPPRFKNNSLTDVVQFLFEYSASINMNCRVKCLELFEKLAPIVKGNIKSYIEQEVGEENWLLGFEQEIDVLTGVANLEACTTSDYIKWFSLLLCSLDGYIFAVKNNITPENIDFEASKIFDALKYYLSKVQVTDFKQFCSIQPLNFEIHKKSIYDNYKYLVATKIIDLVKSIAPLQQCNTNGFSAVFNLEDFKFFINNCLFKPEELGFRLNSTPNYKADMAALIKVLKEKLDPAKYAELFLYQQKYIQERIDSNELSNTNSYSQRMFINGLLLVLQTDCVKVSLPKILPIIQESLFEELDGQVVLKLSSNSTTAEYLKSLQILLIYNNESSDFIEALNIKQTLKVIGNTKPLHYGFYLAEYFLPGLAIIIKQDKQHISTLIHHNCNNSDSTYKLLVIFTNLLKHLEKNKSDFQESDVNEVIQMILNKWGLLIKSFSNSNEATLVGVQILQYSTSVNKFVVDWCLNSLKKKPTIVDKTSIVRLNDYIPILNKVVDYIEENGLEEDLKGCLESIKEIYFVSLKQPSLIETAQNLVLKFIDCMIKTNSVTLIYFTLDFYVMFFKDTDIFLNRCQTFLVRLINNYEDDLKIVSSLYKLCTTFGNNLSKTILSLNIFCSLISHVKIRYFEEFFLDNLEEIFAVLEATNTEYSEEFLLQKITAFLLLETLFSRVNLDTFYTELFGVYSGRDILQKVLKIGFNIFKENYSAIGPYYNEYFRYAYNYLVAIISTTQTNIDFFYKLVLREDDNKDILWGKIVDVSKTYTFSDRFDITPDRKKVVVKIKGQVKETDNQGAGQDKTVKYIESQPLFGSTLCEDITKYDFTNTTVRSQVIDTDEEENDSEENKVARSMHIVLENLEINEHECMATICGLFEHIISLEAKTANTSKLCKILKSLIENKNLHSNIKIFISKAIENMKDTFKHYCELFFEPLVNCITNQTFGDNLNFFNMDIIIMLINWYHNVEKMPSKKSLSDLYKFLITNLDCENNRDIFKYNMSIIKVFVEMWKTHFDVPYEEIVSLLKLPVGSKKIEVGIQVVAMLLSNNIPPWAGSLGSIREVASTLSNILANDYSVVYKSCSETIGMGIKYLSSQPDIQEKFIALTEKKLKLITKKDKLAYCLEAIMKHYPPISKTFLVDLLYDLDNVRGNFKYIYMRIFLNSINILHSWRDLENVNFKNQLNESNIDVQIVTLEFIAKSVSYFSVVQINPIINFIVTKFPNSSNANCRSIMYDICIAVYERYCDSEDELVMKLVKICTNCLLQGLTENEPEIEEKIRSFWSRDNKMPRDTCSKFLFILQTMYSPEIEEHFLAYCVYFMLNCLKDVEGYSEDIFDYPLHECEYTDFVVRCHWREKHATIAPMFASTLQSQTYDYSTPSVSDFNMLRKTQTQFEFTPTQNQNYLSQEKERVLRTYESSILFSEDKEGKEFVNPNDVELSTSYKISNRRFLKDKSMVSRSIAMGQVKKNVKKDELRKDLAVQREKQVTIYRKYKKGDFPDIQIPNSDLIAPLIVLCKYDSQIARQLFGKLFTDVIIKQAPDDFAETISTVIGEIITRSTEYTQHVMGTFLDIAISYKDTIQFSPHIITKVCINSGLMSMGVLLLEEYLIQGFDTPAKIGVSTDTEITCWTHLATLYKELEEIDIVRAIFFAKMNCKENVLEAFDAEAQNEFRSAISLFTTVISEELSSDRRDFYYESYFRCHAELSKWTELTNAISSSVEDSDDLKTVWTALWDKDFNQEKFLPWFMKAELHNIVKDDQRKLNFLGCINDTLQDIDRVDYLKYTFPEEMSFLWILNNDPERSLYYLNIFITNFLNNWSGLNPLFSAIRRNLIIHQRNAMDIFTTVQSIIKATKDNFEEALSDIMSSWENSSSENVSSIILNERRNLYRSTLINILSLKSEKIFSANNGKSDEIKLKLQRTKFILDMNLINSALKQENFHISKTYIKDKNKYFRNADTFEGQQSLLAYSKILYLKAKMTPNPNQQVSVLKESWNAIAELSNTSNNFEDVHLSLNLSEHIFKINQELFQIFNSNNQLFTPEIASSLKTLASSNNNFDNYIDFKKYSINNLAEKLTHYKSSLRSNSKLTKDIAKCYVNIAYFCMKSGESFEKETILYVLKSMYYESKEGCQLFPCLLNLPSLEDETNKEVVEIFLKETSEIPPWMFIQWIPQLLANVDTKKIDLISDIILKIAKAYPYAIVFPYRLSKEKYQFKDSSIKDSCNKLTTLLEVYLPNKTKVDKFLESFASLAAPEIFLADCLIKLIKSVQDKNVFDDIYTSINTELFSVKYSTRDAESSKGMIFNKIEKFKGDFLSITKGKFDVVTIKTKLAKLIQRIKDEFKTNSSRLKDYSPWLHNFSTLKDDFEIEIPGQYFGFRKPLTQYHVKICGFSSEVKRYSSLRQPIQLTILGNDAKEYPFLVKYGEDLRQDQRLQQLFNLMNDTLQSDSNCSQRKLGILTYQVIPLTTRLGIIQWVRDTETLGTVLKDALPDKSSAAFNIAKSKYDKWVTKFSKSKNWKDIYRDMHLKSSRDTVIPIYRSVVNEIPWDILRRVFWKRSTSAESYYVVRASFISTYASMCLAHWLLGIGDRHLENTKIALTTGKVVGVDFGHAFGTATEVLPVPELVPMRLTPCIINLMQPLNEHGLLQETMIHTLRALRAFPDAFLATLDVFVREPSVDWLDCARQANLHDAAASSSGHDDELLVWYPLQKVDRVKDKLVNGAHPSSVMCQELGTRGKRDDDCLRQRLLDLVRGDAAFDLRARISDSSLSAEEQVRCLLDQATDYNLLGRMYVGWEAWV